MLFGHQNEDNNQITVATSAPQIDQTVNPVAVDSSTGVSLPVPPIPSGTDTQSPSIPETVAPVQVSSLEELAAVPAETDQLVSEIVPSQGVPAETSFSNPEVATTSDDLLSIKQQALTQLSPLVSQLDQTPEEKFRTTMMMIQSTDNQSLLKDAYEAAQAIADEKARAQALLDVVNEINYFTQQSAN